MSLAKIKFLSLAIIAVFALQVPVALARKNAPVVSPRGNVEAITAAQMRDYLTFIASDELEGRDTPSRGLNIAALYISSLLSRWGLKPAGDNGTYFQRFAVKRQTTGAAQSAAEMTQNVVAVIEGSDPVLKKEYVAIGAHYDHVGIGPPVNGDAIYNGADDNGSGTVALMAMAEAASQGRRPKRSLLFIWHAGEEQGLWGSYYFTRSPTVPTSQIIAQLNIDMIGRARTPHESSSVNKNLAERGEVFVIGSRMMSTELGELSESVNRSYLNLKFNYKYDDPNDPEKFFFRSDHYNYAQKGIPVIFYMDGDHDDYHKPSDSIEKIDFEHMERIARTIYATAWELANRPTRPRVDKKLPFEITGK